MKCQKCEKPATFHITDLSGDEVLALHLCPDCAKTYLQPEEIEADSPAPTTVGFLQQQLKLEQTAEDLKELDAKECPVCGITFFEFRQNGRLGCPHDYEYFGSELEPLLLKRPWRSTTCRQTAQTQQRRFRRVDPDHSPAT